MMNKINQYADIANNIAEKTDTDIIYYNGPIERWLDTTLINNGTKRLRRKNVALILTTCGGNPDVAYKMARYLQNSYENFTIIITGYCKSAGSLIALGANEIVMTDHGELGPLDMQMSKKDEIWDSQSGLTVNSSLASLRSQAFDSFIQFFINTGQKTEGAITTKTAADIATNLVCGLYSPIFRQVDPMHVGEAGRAMAVAAAYGQRLLKKSKNYSKETITHLVNGYPSHGFVINREEAEILFNKVRKPNENEIELINSLGNSCVWPNETASNNGENILIYLNKEIIATPADLTPAVPAEENIKKEGGANEVEKTGNRNVKKRSVAGVD